MEKIFFFENINEALLTELDEFLEEHQKEKVSYQDWLYALTLNAKVLTALAESCKEYGEIISKTLEKYDLNNKTETQKLFLINKINSELGKYAVVRNVQIELKLAELCKKHY